MFHSDMSTDNLKYLSSEQALADLAYFHQYMTDKLQLSDNKWIAFGGSYPGMWLVLAAVLSADRNDTVIAAVFHACQRERKNNKLALIVCYLHLTVLMGFLRQYGHDILSS